MPRLAEKLLVMLCAAGGHGVDCCPGNAEAGVVTSCSCAHILNTSPYVETKVCLDDPSRM